MLNGILQAMTNMCVSPSFNIRSCSHWICQLTGRRRRRSEFRHSYIFPVLSRSTALLSITYKKGAEKKKGEMWQQRQPATDWASS